MDRSIYIIIIVVTAVCFALNATATSTTSTTIENQSELSDLYPSTSTSSTTAAAASTKPPPSYYTVTKTNSRNTDETTPVILLSTEQPPIGWNDLDPQRITTTAASDKTTTNDMDATDVTSSEEAGHSYKYLSMSDICTSEPDCSLRNHWNAKTLRNMSDNRCFCDGKCVKFGDCCRPSGSPADKTVRCIDILHFPDKRIGLYGKINCPDGSLCYSTDEDTFSRLPAFARESGVVYRNTFCAMCNDEKLEDLVFGKLTLDCEQGFNSSHIEGNKLRFFSGSQNVSDPLGVRAKCQMQYTLPEPSTWNATAVRCIPSVDSCPSGTRADLATLCSSYMETVFLDKVYQNPYCAICRGHGYETLGIEVCTSPLLDTGEPLVPKFFNASAQSAFEGKHATGYSLTILLDLNLENGNIVGSTKKCPTGQVFDPFNEICRNVHCSGGRHYVDGQCRQVRTEPVPTSAPVNADLINDAASTVSWILTECENGSADCNPMENSTVTSEDKECPQIEFQPSEYAIIESLLFLNASGKWYNLSDVVFNGQTAAVCLTDDYEQYVNSFSQPEIILSIVCYVASIVCLIVHFLMYFLAGKYRLVPDLNMLSISSAIFFVQIFVLFAPLAQRYLLLDSTICTISGVLLHYFILASFTWSGVIAYDITKITLSVKNPKSSTVTYLQFVRYSLLAWLVSAVPVVIGLILDAVIPHSPYSPVYGKNVCYVGRRKALWILFGAPVAFILLTNMILYVITASVLFKSYRRRRAMKTIKSSSDRSSSESSSTEYRLYVRLAMIMGLAWITAFLAIWVPALRYVSIVANGGQGVYIFVAFSVKRSIFRAIKVRRSSAGGSFFGRSTKSSLSSASSQVSTARLTPKLSSKSSLSQETKPGKTPTGKAPRSASVKMVKQHEDYYLTTLYPPAAH